MASIFRTIARTLFPPLKLFGVGGRRYFSLHHRFGQGGAARRRKQRCRGSGGAILLNKPYGAPALLTPEPYASNALWMKPTPGLALTGLGKARRRRRRYS